MSCERYAEAIVDHACGADLPADAAAHLRACGSCTALFHEQRRLIEGLDGELRAALAIEPSVQFGPRVRAAIASAPPSNRHRSMFWWTGLAAAAAAGIIVSTVPSVERLQPPAAPASTTEAAPSIASATAPAIDTPRTPPETAPAAASVSAIGRHASAQPANEPPREEPEIIVPEDQRRAVARFVALVRTGQLDTSSLATQPDDEIAPPAELAVFPLAVSPIAIPSVEFSTSSAVPVNNDGLPKGVEPR